MASSLMQPIFVLLFVSLFCASQAFFASSVAAVHTCSSSSSSSLPATASTKTTTEIVKNNYDSSVMNTYGRYPLTISHGKGVYLYDTTGREYLDFAAGIATCCLGHANAKLRDAVAQQMDRVHHCSNLYFIPEQGALAKWLVKGSCLDKVFFCNSGAEANEAAIKLARRYAVTKLNVQFPIILTAVNSFHGRTLTAITATGQPKYQKDFGPLTPGFRYITYNDIASLRSAVQAISGERSYNPDIGLAAIMMEPLQGEGGIKPGDSEFFSEVRRLCDQTGALMIVDEVQTGIGRTGKMWGYQNLNIEPDVITSAKALGGGVPIGAMLCKDRCNVFGPGDHASTYGGNPLACAAGLAVADAIDNEGILANVVDRGNQLRSMAGEIKKRNPNLIEDVRGWGLINGVELTESSGLTAADVTKVLMENGVLVVPAGPKVIRFVPPLIVSEEEITNAMKLFEAALQQLSTAASKK